MHVLDRISQDRVILQNRPLESRVFENLSPCGIAGQLRFVAELDHELIGLVCSAGDVTLGMEAFDGVCQDWVVVFEDGIPDGWVFKDLSPGWIAGELGLITESDFEFIGVIRSAGDVPLRVQTFSGVG